MENNFLLKTEFENYLDNLKGVLCFKTSFYINQIIKLTESHHIMENQICLFEMLENEIRCDNQEKVEEIIIKFLDNIEQKAIRNNAHIIDNKWNALRIGLLKYRLFLHQFMKKKQINNSAESSNIFDHAKRKRLELLFDKKDSYFVPIYHDIYTSNQLNIDYIWQICLQIHSNNTFDSKEKRKPHHFYFETITVRQEKKRVLEIINGGNTFIMLTLLLHALNAFSKGDNFLNKTRYSEKTLIKTLQFETNLNDQKFFNILIKNHINKKATTPEEIIKMVPYKFLPLSLNEGHHFLETTFQFVQLIQESQIPQSENYIADINVFINSVLRNSSINFVELTDEHYGKTYLNDTEHLIQDVMSWL